MQILSTIVLLAISSVCLGQIKTIYCFPGQGSDKRIFDSLAFDPTFEVRFIEYGTPKKGASLRSFAQELAREIDTTQSFALIGVSLGGMICAELSEILNPEKTIIISSAKNRNELPARYRFQKVIPLYKIVPAPILLGGAKMLQPIVEPDRKNNKDTFKQMLAAKDAKYMKRTIDLVIHWDRETNSKKIHQIHGTNDHTLPIRKIKAPDSVIENGSHMMTLTRGEKIGALLDSLIRL